MGEFNDLKLSAKQKSSLKDYLEKLDEIKKLYLEKKDISEIILKTIDVMHYFSY